MSKELYPYQKEAIESIKKVWARKKSALICTATGTGKTTIALNVVKGLCYLFVVHRDYLLYQTQQQAHEQILILSGKNKLPKKINSKAPVCATQQWLSRPKNLERLFNTFSFDALVLDEAHHAVADSWRNIKDQFELAYPNAHVLGMTATLQRPDLKPLSSVFDELAYYKPIKYFADNAYLSKVKSFTFECDIDVSRVAVSRETGDFVNGQRLEAAINTSNWLDVTVSAWKEHADNKKTIAFCLTVQNSIDLANEFNEHGITAMHVDAKTSKEERARIDWLFRNGEITVLCNVSIYNEGYDVPDAECAIMARPTKSQLYYIQCVGRVLRYRPDKMAIVLDMTDTKQTLAQFGDIEPCYRAESERDLYRIQGYSAAFYDALMLSIHQRRGLIQFGKARDAYARITDLLRNNKIAWGIFGDRALLSSGNGDIFIDKQDDNYLIYLIKNNSVKHIATSDIFDILEKAADIAEQYATILSDATAQWRSLPLTQNQMYMLVDKMFLSQQSVEGLNRGDGSLLISYIKCCNLMKFDIGGQYEHVRREILRQRKVLKEQVKLKILNNEHIEWAEEVHYKLFYLYRNIEQLSEWEKEFVNDVTNECIRYREDISLSWRQEKVIEEKYDKYAAIPGQGSNGAHCQPSTVKSENETANKEA